jgi:hypothetical protein
LKINRNWVRQQDSPDLLSRAVALLLACAVQLALVTMFTQRRERTLPATKTMTLIRIAEQPDPRSEAAESRREPAALSKAVIAPSSSSPVSVPSENAPRSAPLQIDTEAIAAAAVAKIIAEENRRHLDGRKPFQITEPTVPSVFEQPRRSLGDVEHDPASDVTTIWHSDDCFTLIKPKDPAGSSLPNYRQCMFKIGKPEPRGDLFEHLRKPKPLPEAKPGVPVELAYPEEKK